MKKIYNKNNFETINFSNKDKLRKNLEGVYFTDKYTVATDFRTLLKVEVPKLNADDYPEFLNGQGIYDGKIDFILKAKDLKNVKFLKNKSLLILNDTVVFTKNDEKTVEIANTDLSSINKQNLIKVDEKFPEFEKIIPSEESLKENYVKINIDPEFLEKMAKAMRQINKNNREKFCSIYINKNENNKAMYFEGLDKVNNQKAVGLIMPLTM